ncbi:hypothetical protein OROGR_020364 [Orobanche gracilis]
MFTLPPPLPPSALHVGMCDESSNVSVPKTEAILRTEIHQKIDEILEVKFPNAKSQRQTVLVKESVSAIITEGTAALHHASAPDLAPTYDVELSFDIGSANFATTVLALFGGNHEAVNLLFQVVVANPIQPPVGQLPLGQGQEHISQEYLSDILYKPGGQQLAYYLVWEQCQSHN